MVTVENQAAFKSNKSIESPEDTFEKRRLFPTSLVKMCIPKASEWESSYETIAVAIFLVEAACIICLYRTWHPVELNKYAVVIILLLRIH